MIQAIVLFRWIKTRLSLIIIKFIIIIIIIIIKI